MVGQASVAKGAFYFYFPRKEHMLVILRYDRLTLGDQELQALMASLAPATWTA